MSRLGERKIFLGRAEKDRVLVDAKDLVAIFQCGFYVVCDRNDGHSASIQVTEKIVHIGGGCYIRKTDREAFRVLVEKLEKEKNDALAADTTGEGIIKDMFLYELGNHEYCVTYDLEDTLDAVGLSVDEINADKRLLCGLKKALSQYLKDSENY